MRSAGYPLLLVMLIFTIALLTKCSPRAPSSLSSPGTQLGPKRAGPATPTTHPGEVEIVIWAPAFRQNHGRLDGPVQAAGKVTNFKIKVTPVNFDELSESDFWEEVAQAAEAGEGPDIAFADTTHVLDWASAGYLLPLDECQTRYLEFDDVMDSLWPTVTWKGQVWAIPLEIYARPLFFSKLKLKALGWSDAQVAALPEQIERGEFILDDLVATAQAATQKGVVEPGFGYWPTPYKGTDFMHVYVAYGGRQYDLEQGKFVIVKDALTQAYAFQRRLVESGIRLDNFLGPEKNTWGNRLIYRDTVVRHRALFWNGYFWDWPTWAMDYIDNLGGRDYLSDTIGYALRPSGLRGKPGNIGVHLGVYVIMSERASGHKNQDAACALLAKTVTPEINAMHAAESVTLGVLDSPASQEAYSQYRLTAGTMHMRDYIWFAPPDDHAYREVLMDFLIMVENGDMTPTQAAAAAVEQLRSELGEAILVE
jgi:inositol-phosphate transport system substrate-binding protein